MKKKLLIPCVCASALVIAGWIYWGNGAIEPSFHTVRSEKLPHAFDGFTIAHLSDIHNSPLAKSGGKLLSILRESEPDIIAITGDMIDSRQTDIALALGFAAEAVKIAPCYYVPGNHEARIDAYPKFADALAELGVTVLEDDSLFIEKDGEFIRVVGLVDPVFHANKGAESGKAVLSEELLALTEDAEEEFLLILSHRPEIIDIYSSCDVSLALCGHAHGGQIRLPAVGGLIAPHQGWFPEYDSGLYQQDETQMIVSRGIGNSLFPFRVNNKPDVPVIELKKA